MGTALNPNVLRRNVSRCVSLQVLANTIQLCPGISFSRNTRYVSLYLKGRKRYDCIRVETVVYFVLTATRTGLVRLARCSFWTFEVMVAEKRYVCRCFGNTDSNLSRMAPKSTSNNRSASSRTYSNQEVGLMTLSEGEHTKYFKVRRLNPFVDSR